MLIVDHVCESGTDVGRGTSYGRQPWNGVSMSLSEPPSGVSGATPEGRLIAGAGNLGSQLGWRGRVGRIVAYVALIGMVLAVIAVVVVALVVDTG